MICTCGTVVHPAYENDGICEDCWSLRMWINNAPGSCSTYSRFGATGRADDDDNGDDEYAQIARAAIAGRPKKGVGTRRTRAVRRRRTPERSGIILAGPLSSERTGISA
jgi:hypothetical protein